MRSPRQPTMQQIAEAAGVSRMAVSLALRNSPRISPETTRRIRGIAEELGYRPNPMVSALMTQLRHGRDVKRPSTIAYLTSYRTEDGWQRREPFASFCLGARQRAAQLGYELEICWLGTPGRRAGELCETLLERDIRGMIVAPLPAGAPQPELIWEGFSAATIGYTVTGRSLHRASNNQYGTIRQALRELTRRGYRRIGLAMPAENDERVQHYWSAGLLTFQQALPAGESVLPLLSTGSFASALVEWVRREKPDCVISQERHVPRVLRTLGYRVPDDIGFAHLALSGRETGCAGMDQKARLVGAAALDLVDAQLRHNERGLPSEPQTVLIEGVWVDGTSVRPAPADLQ